MIRRSLVLALLGTMLAAPLAGTKTSHAAPRSSLPTCCPAPVVHGKAFLYRYVGARWEPTTTLHLGDRARFVLRFRLGSKSGSGGRAPAPPSARVIIWKAHPRSYNNEGLLFRSAPAARSRLRDGFWRFTKEIDVPGRVAWLGRHQVMFSVASSQGQAGVYLSPPVTIFPARAT